MSEVSVGQSEVPTSVFRKFPTKRKDEKKNQNAEVGRKIRSLAPVTVPKMPKCKKLKAEWWG